MFRRIIYIIKLFYRELLGITDYWHPKLPFRRVSHIDEYKNKYYLDFSAKGKEYPYILENGIPLLPIDGTDIKFSITIFNYGLGLIDNLETDKSLKINIISILEWALKNQNEIGEWQNIYEVPYFNLKYGWTSAMGQGLGISFLVRCYFLNLYNKPNEILDKISKAKDALLQEKHMSIVNKSIILQEYENTGFSVLNGAIFALYGLRDYDLIYKTMLFDQYSSHLSGVFFKYNFSPFWSKYSLSGIICSKFYHKLHIEMMSSLNFLTGNKVFIKYSNFWKFGIYLAPIFLILKGLQKIFNFNTVKIHP